jgi:hypothetical protein
VNGKNIFGGKGKEIDILGIKTTGERIWVEVTVSPNPYLARTDEQVTKMVDTVKGKFHIEKENEVKRLFNNKSFHKMFVYSKRVFSGAKEDKIGLFSESVKELDVELVEFERVLNETVAKLSYYSVDPTRIYLYYAKFYLQPKVLKPASNP